MREIEMHDTNGITFLAVAESGGKTYFSAWNHNGLFQLHQDGTTDFIMLFDKYGDESPSHEFAISIRDSVMFIPSVSDNEIAIFTPKTGEIKYLKYPVSKKVCMCRPFWGYVNRKKTTYLLPNSYDAVLAFHQDSGEFQRYVLPVEADAFCEEKSVFINGITVDETVYFCPWNYSDVISFNLETHEFQVLGKVKKNTFRHMFYLDKKIFLIPRVLETDFIAYDINENLFLERGMPSGIKGICVCAFADKNGNIYFLPNGENNIWRWNPAFKSLDLIKLKISNKISKDRLSFNEARDLWGGTIISPTLETVSRLMFNGEKIELLDISKKNQLFWNILTSMLDNHSGVTIHEY